MLAFPFNPLWPLLRNLSRPARPTLPSHASSLDLVQWPQTWQQQHQQFIGFHAAPALSFSYLPLQTAQLASMLQPEFGPSLLGLVHVSQRLQRFAETPHAEPLHIETSWQASRRIDRPGSFLDCQQRIYCQQSRTLLLAGHSRYLSKLSWPAQHTTDNIRVDKPDSTESFETMETCCIKPSQGRHYARLSGDWNPIHLGHWPARLFGLPSALVHGAYLLSLLERVAAQPLAQLEVQFLKPVRYQQPMQLGVSHSGLWQIRQGDVLCLSASFTPQSAAPD